MPVLHQKIPHVVCIPMMPMYPIDVNYKVRVVMECVTGMKTQILVAKIVVDVTHAEMANVMDMKIVVIVLKIAVVVDLLVEMAHVNGMKILILVAKIAVDVEVTHVVIVCVKHGTEKTILIAVRIVEGVLWVVALLVAMVHVNGMKIKAIVVLTAVVV